nr:acidic mammalian chitinase-like [Ipomoea trifida]
MTGPNLHNMFGFLIVLLSLSFGYAKPSHSSSVGVKGAYWPSWAESDFPPSAIDTTLFTHIYYAFLVPNNATFQFDVDAATATQLLRFTSTLRSKNPPVKTLYSVGGGGVDGSLFTRMASSAATRKSFIDSSIQVARKYGFDGIDLDWEMPQNPTEMDYFGLLLGDWRAAVAKEARATRRPQLLLTAATYFSVDFFLAQVYRAYPVAAINKNLDWINAMCYDYHGSWDTSATGAQAALFDPKSNISTHYGLGRWIKAGLLRSKLIMGLPLYGRTWKLKDSRSYGIGAPAVDVGPGGGTLRFEEIEAFNEANNATVVYDAATVSVYSVAGTSWIGYDDPRSISVKVKYAQALKLRGYFFWSVNGDHQWKVSKQAKQSWVFP